MAGDSRPNWLAIRTYYFSSSTITYEQCHQKFGVSSRSIESKGSKEGWVDERRRIFGEAQVQLRGTSVADAGAGLAQHADLADQLVAAVKTGLAELHEMKPGRSKAETLKTLAETADKAVRLSRDVRGIRQGEPSKETNEETGLELRYTVHDADEAASG